MMTEAIANAERHIVRQCNVGNAQWICSVIKNEAITTWQFSNHSV